MDKDAEAKLAAALTRRRTAVTRLELEKAAAEKALAEKSARKDASRQRWAMSLQEIGAAIESVNERLRGDGLQLKIAEASQATPPAIAQLYIVLHDEKAPDVKNRQLVLNISAYGKAQPRAYGPHALGKIDDFEINEADQGKYEQVLSEFVALVFS
ncbi:MAG: hypothetical protein HY852_03520 [Bradyrhizobium sp.]|uniref:hypothetical protein n=1 Tax=Bradyrhizobium sp. TaxID=376 RepID=UPI0025C68377|nr:hypothetical protein [Bradyrhizobium sp.]MBI5260872.1 hypothetical protein [Bradyrhizobium sp.]